MDILKLKAFLVCCEEMNYSRAADRLFSSRQALRQTIQAMEKELDTELFSTCRNRLSLTAGGEAVRTHAHRLTEGYAAMLAEISALRGTDLRLGISSSLLPFCTPELPGYLDGFAAAHPELRLELTSLPSDQLAEDILSGQLTAGILTLMDCKTPGLEADVISLFPAGVTFSGAHRFAALPQIGVENLDGERCLVMGSPALILRPLLDAADRVGAQPDFQVVPSAKTAFYRMEHENCVMIEYTYPSTKRLQVEQNRPLSGGFVWSLSLLRRAGDPGMPLLLLRDFLAAKYERLIGLRLDARDR